MPQGYSVIDGNCTQVFLANETKDIVFSVKEIGSPEPNNVFEITTKHNGKVKKVTLSSPGKRTPEYLEKQAAKRHQKSFLPVLLRFINSLSPISSPSPSPSLSSY